MWPQKVKVVTLYFQKSFFTGQTRRGKRDLQWTDLGPKLLNIYTEVQYPGTFSCMVCGKEQERIIHCPDCRYGQLFCYDCYEKNHMYAVFHRPQVWDNSVC